MPLLDSQLHCVNHCRLQPVSEMFFLNLAKSVDELSEEQGLFLILCSASHCTTELTRGILAPWAIELKVAFMPSP